MKALVHVTLKPDVLDPQGKAIRSACGQLGYAAVESVRQGKLFEIELDARSPRPRRAGCSRSSRASCSRIPVIEDYAILSNREPRAIPRLRAIRRRGSSVSGSKSRPVICSNASM